MTLCVWIAMTQSPHNLVLIVDTDWCFGVGSGKLVSAVGIGG